MPFLLALLAAAFPRLAIVLLWLFTNYFNHVFEGFLIPVLGFLFLPLTLLVYTYLEKTFGRQLTTIQMVILAVTVIIDLGLFSGGRFRRKSA
jgi:hypothetical protein